MAMRTSLGSTGGAVIGGAAVAAVGVAAVVGYVFVLPSFQADDPAVSAPTEISAPATETVTAAPQDPVAAPIPTPEPPVFDVVRIDAKGAALIAGIAPAGARVKVLLDGIAVTNSTTGNDGRFVAIFDIVPSTEPRSLQLASISADETQLMSEQTVLIAPFGAAPTPTPSAALAAADAEPGVGTTDQAAVQAQTAPGAAPETPTETPTAAAPRSEPDPEPTEMAETAPEPAPTETPTQVQTHAQTETQTQPEAAPAVTETASVARAPALVIADADGVRPLQPATAPAAPTTDARANVIIDTISYDANGAVELAGRGTAEAFVRIYLNNAAIADVGINQAGIWATVLADIDPGIYTMRVDELDANGAVLSRFETPFKREDPDVLARFAQALNPAAPVEESPVEDAPAEDAPAADTQVADNGVEVAQGETAAADAGAGTDAATTELQVLDQEAGTGDGAPETPPAAPQVAALAAPDTAQDSPAPQAEPAPEPQPTPEAAQVVADAPTAPQTPDAAADTVQVASAETASNVVSVTEPAQPQIAAQADPVPTTPLASVVTVQPGFTLWQIARDRFGEGELYVQVFEANREQIKDPDRIFPGQVFALPEIEAK